MTNPFYPPAVYGEDDMDLLGLDDDDFGEDDDFGRNPERMAQKKMAELARLKALYPSLRGLRRNLAGAKIKRIAKWLSKHGIDPRANTAAIAASGIEGVGSLMFTAQSPPGLGRLLRLPFYPTQANAGVVTSAGLGFASTTNPVFIEDPVGANASGTEHALQTPQISWATLRIVGFETSVQDFRGISNPGGRQLVADLKIGGGANLFTHEDFADASIYDANQPEFCGLRDYPVLRSPNVAEVATLYVGDIAGETATVSCSLLVEALVDDNYGAHIPGPYARKGAMVRQGGSFAR